MSNPGGYLDTSGGARVSACTSCRDHNLVCIVVEFIELAKTQRVTRIVPELFLSLDRDAGKRNGRLSGSEGDPGSSPEGSFRY